MEHISYEELQDALPAYFHNYTRYTLTLQNCPNVKGGGFNSLSFLDLRYVKEDIINCSNSIAFKSKDGVNILLPSHLVSINFTGIHNIKFLFFPQSLKRIIIKEGGYPFIGSEISKMYNLPDLPRNLIYLCCSGIGLNNIPFLPETLKFLDCSDNKDITKLPELPAGLMVLKCLSTTLKRLPELPNNLIELSFGGGGKDHPIYLPETFPINLEDLEIGTGSGSVNEASIREEPHDYLDIEEGEEITPDMINLYIQNQRKEADSAYTTFENPESFTRFPPNLKKIAIIETNLSSFPTTLPSIWNKSTRQEYFTESPNRFITTYHPNPIIQTPNFSMELTCNAFILDDQKYLPLLENIKELNKKHGLNMDGKRDINFTYCPNERHNEVILDDLINKLQSDTHAAFNQAIAKGKKIDTKLTTERQETGTSIGVINPKISEFLSTNKQLQQKTIDYSKKGGRKHKRSNKTKQTKKTKRSTTRKLHTIRK